MLGLCLIIMVSLTGLILSLMQKQALGASGNIYVAPIDAISQKGTQVRVVARIVPGTRVDTVTASIKYDTDALTYTKADYTGSPFSSQIPATVKDGIITVQTAKLGGQTVESDALIATLLFVTKKDSTSVPKLIYGNAAFAGTATNPNIEGQAADKTADPLAVPSSVSTSNQAKTTKGPNAGVGVNPLLSPFASLLKSAGGVSSETAKRAAPWLAASTVSIMAGAAIFSWQLYQRHQKKKNLGGIVA